MEDLIIRRKHNNNNGNLNNKKLIKCTVRPQNKPFNKFLSASGYFCHYVNCSTRFEKFIL